MQNRNDPSFLGTSSTGETRLDVTGLMTSVLSCFQISSYSGSRVQGPAQ